MTVWCSVWLRAIDALNRETDFSEFAVDPVFKVFSIIKETTKFPEKVIREL